MIIILRADTPETDPEYQRLLKYLGGFANIELRTHKEAGAHQVLTEIYLVGDTLSLNAKDIEAFVVVERVIRVSREYRILVGHHTDDGCNWPDVKNDAKSKDH